MGQPKQLLPWGEGGTVLGAVLDHVAASGADEILLASGAERQAVEAIGRQKGARCVFNANWSSGEMLSSLQAGLRALDPHVDAALVVLADQPSIPRAVFRAVVAAGRAHHLAEGIVVPSYRGHLGHPVLIGRNHFASLLALSPGQRPRGVIERARSVTLILPVSTAAVIEDLDNVEDYLAALRKRDGEHGVR